MICIFGVLSGERPQRSVFLPELRVHPTALGEGSPCYTEVVC